MMRAKSGRFSYDQTIKMAQLTFEVIKKSCAFVLQIREPAETVKRLMMFFIDRRIVIDSLQMQRLINDRAMLIIHCQIEKDRIGRTAQLLEQLTGIIEMEKMEAK